MYSSDNFYPHPYQELFAWSTSLICYITPVKSEYRRNVCPLTTQNSAIIPTYVSAYIISVCSLFIAVHLDISVVHVEPQLNL